MLLHDPSTPTVPIFDTADDPAGHDRAAGHEERHRQRDEQGPLEMLGHELLYHVGGVGAEHDHLAVGHVDDTHDAEGDGKSDGGEQQHRT